MSNRVLVCGGRYYPNRWKVFAALDDLHEQTPIDVLIHGAAPGADSFAGEWALKNNVPVSAFKAEWKKYGASAGPRRNKQMLIEGKPDPVLAFPGGKGTENMLGLARTAGVRIQQVDVSQAV